MGILSASGLAEAVVVCPGREAGELGGRENQHSPATGRHCARPTETAGGREREEIRSQSGTGGEEAGGRGEVRHSAGRRRRQWGQEAERHGDGGRRERQWGGRGVKKRQWSGGRGTVGVGGGETVGDWVRDTVGVGKELVGVGERQWGQRGENKNWQLLRALLSPGTE